MSIADTLREHVVPLRTLEATDDDSDLAVLREVVGDARVVCLGESAHYVTEFGGFKDRVLRFLVRELGFSAFVLESGFAEGLAVGDWVRGGPGELAELARTGITYNFGDCAGMRGTLRWLREHGVAYHGMDVPGGCANPLPAVAACLARLPQRGGDDALLALADLGDRYGAPGRFRAMSDVDRHSLVSGVAELARRAADDDIARRCARSAALVLDFLATGANPRDGFMADTVRWLLGRERRIVVSAHNGHVQRAPLFGTTSLGQHLAAALGDGLAVIGTTHGPGEIPALHAGPDGTPSLGCRQVTPGPETVDALLATAGPGPHLVRTGRLPAGLLAGVTSISAETVTCELDPATAFDALVHIPTTTPDPESLAAVHATLPGT